MSGAPSPLVAAPAIRFAHATDRGLRRFVEVAAAVLVLAEIAILSAGVVARFVLNAPLVWSDELASILFLWLAMLGAVLALQRGQHMRLTTVVGMMPGRVASFFHVLAVGAAGLFALLLLPNAVDYAQDQWFIETPALGWSDAVRTAALPVGCGLMLLTCLAQLAEHRLRDLAVALAVLGAIAALLWLGGPALRAMGHWNLVVFFRADVPFFFYLGALARLRGYLPMPGRGATSALVALYVALVLLRASAPLLVDVDAPGMAWLLDFATRAMRPVGVLACWGVCLRVTAAPWSDDRSTRRRALPSVVPKPRSSGSATTVATRLGSSPVVTCSLFGLISSCQFF